MAKSTRYAALTQPLKLRNKVMKSRFVYPVAQPHFLQANETYPGDAIIEFYKGRARNGTALILMHDLTNLDQRYMGDSDVSHFAMYDLDDKGAQNGFTQFAEYMHMMGTLVCPELMVDNRIPLQVNDPDVPDPRGGMPPFMMMGMDGGDPDDEDQPPRPPMPMGMGPGMEPPENPLKQLIDGAPGWPKKYKKPGGGFVSGAPGSTPRDCPQIKGDLMEYYIQAMIQHAKTYQNLNFDGGFVEFAAHNFMLGKFLYPSMNWRTDEYGGSLENRCRFPLEVLRRLREALGEEFIIAIGCPNTAEDFPEEELVWFLKQAEQYVDIMQLRHNHPDHEKYEVCTAAEQSARLKAAGVKIPTVVATYYKDLDSLNKIIAEGKVDGVAPGHLMICNDNMNEILRDGNGEDLNPCIECHICRGSSSTGDWMSHCTINPLIGMEHQAWRFIKPVTRLKRVAVIGGGPGGMKCALWLKERGHTPVLFEATKELGGQIKSANYPDFKWELKRYLDYLKNQMVRKEIEVRMNTFATPEMVEDEGFDAVVVAIGGYCRKPEVEGAENCRWDVTNIYGHEQELGKKVVVIGGNSTSAEAACYLAECGHEVVELSRSGRFASDLNPIRMIGYMNGKLRKCGVKTKPQCETLKIEDGKVTYKNYKGDIKTILCDDVVVNGGIVPDHDASAKFVGCCREYYVIGDARQPGTMRHAIRDAFAVAHQI